MEVLEKRIDYIESNVYTPFIVNNSNSNIRLVGLKKVNNKLLLKLDINELASKNYHIHIFKHCLTIILTDKEYVTRPQKIYNLDRNLFSEKDSEEFKSIDIWLPADNFYIVKYNYNTEDNLLEIYLGEEPFD